MFFSQKRKFNYEFYTNKLKIFYSRVLKDVFIVKNVLIGAFYVVLNDVLVHFFTKFWKFKKTAFFRYVKRLGMTTVDRMRFVISGVRKLNLRSAVT